jgi:hypothetical protein
LVHICQGEPGEIEYTKFAFQGAPGGTIWKGGDGSGGTIGAADGGGEEEAVGAVGAGLVTRALNVNITLKRKNEKTDTAEFRQRQDNFKKLGINARLVGCIEEIAPSQDEGTADETVPGIAKKLLAGLKRKLLQYKSELEDVEDRATVKRNVEGGLSGVFEEVFRGRKIDRALPQIQDLVVRFLERLSDAPTHLRFSPDLDSCLEELVTQALMAAASADEDDITDDPPEVQSDLGRVDPVRGTIPAAVKLEAFRQRVIQALSMAELKQVQASELDVQHAAGGKEVRGGDEVDWVEVSIDGDAQHASRAGARHSWRGANSGAQTARLQQVIDRLGQIIDDAEEAGRVDEQQQSEFERLCDEEGLKLKAAPTEPTINILFLDYCSPTADRLDLDGEYQTILAINPCLRLVRCRDVSAEKLQRELLQSAAENGGYHFVHFSGHGATGKLAMNDVDTGAEQLLSTKGVASLFANFAKTCLRDLRCVLLNACSSGDQGESMCREGIRSVICFRGGITDSAAKHFSQGFYQAVAHGSGVDDAYDQAGNLLQAKHDGERFTPLLLPKRTRELVAISAEEASNGAGRTCSDKGDCHTRQTLRSNQYEALKAVVSRNTILNWPTGILYECIQSTFSTDTLMLIYAHICRRREDTGGSTCHRPFSAEPASEEGYFYCAVQPFSRAASSAVQGTVRP